ncbi:Ger(x)C family spore germination protein [Bacillus sp. FJAT-28004]|uniref:Ger(x)C family spore germination protein n=1 Tax=Bacillus sp. FJAT-28004 TaxID=1679165 RepID=UPI0009E98509|nr:Ger(x)C family spore germination protein [Bacillus sp. FJAT-28004]
MMVAAWFEGWCRLWRKGIALICILVMSALLQGCWDEVNLQDVSYISAFGIDYIDGHYEIYGQTIKFGLIAKTESLQPDPNPVWIGKGEGDTVLLAVNDLARSGQTILSLEHLKTVIVQERAMIKINDIMDGLNRQRASRYTSLIFGTKAPIEKIFTSDTFFDQSPLNSIMYMPGPLDSQRSFIRPYAMQLAVQTLNEPAMLTTLPALNANQEYWKRKKQALQIQLIEGIFVFKDHQYLGYLTETEASGLRWVDPEFKHFMLKAEGKQGKSAISITSSKSRLQASFKEGKPYFALKVRLEGNVAEMDGSMQEQEIVSSIETRIKQEIENTFRIGLTKKIGFFHLEHHLYRYHQAFWQQACKGTNWLPKPDQLKIEVDFQLIHTGNFDLNIGT